MERIYPEQSTRDREAWLSLLKEQGLRPVSGIPIYGIFREGQLVATGAIDGDILKCIAVSDEEKGGATLHELISGLLSLVYEQGPRTVFVYTKPAAVGAFRALGFHEIERGTPQPVFMENRASFPVYLANLQEGAFPTAQKIGAIVLNANPLTRGHLSLIQRALEEVEALYLFIVSEDRSAFSTKDRKRWLLRAVRDDSRIQVRETGPYLISSQTFPNYFLREDSQQTEVQAGLDARIFALHIAPALGIRYRFVGEEPFSASTNTYNRVMDRVFQQVGEVTLRILPRLRSDGIAISASAVRKNCTEGNFDAMEKVLPDFVFQDLKQGRYEHRSSMSTEGR